MRTARTFALVGTTAFVVAAGMTPSAASDSTVSVSLTHLRHACASPHTFKVHAKITHLTKGATYTLTASTANYEDTAPYQFKAKSATFAKNVKFKMEPTALPKTKSSIYFVLDHNRAHGSTQLYGIAPSNLPHCH